MLALPNVFQRARAWLVAIVAAALALPALAQSDPPGRVGRVAWVSGEVALVGPNVDSPSGRSTPALLNQPLTSGDVIITGPGARAEIQIGAMTLRADANTRIAFEQIDDDRLQLRLDAGHVIVRLTSEDTRRDFTMETSYGRFAPRETGVYRFDENGGDLVASAYFGTLRFGGRDLAFDVNAGASAYLWRDRDGRIAYRMAQGIRDEFTQWDATRDARRPAPVASRYLSPEMTGAEDLDAYGDWRETDEYGAVWIPRGVAADWAPYRSGQWVWVAPWGWTWVGREAWGFAPFHYGRWARIHGVWAWVPGTRSVRPVYAPALVVWRETPPGSVTFDHRSPPRPGWAPLAPRDAYLPYYRASRSHVERVNAPIIVPDSRRDPIAPRDRDAFRRSPAVSPAASARMERIERMDGRENRDDTSHRFEGRSVQERINRSERRFDSGPGTPRDSRFSDARHEPSARPVEVEQRPVRQNTSAPAMMSRDDYNRRRNEEREMRSSAPRAESPMARQNSARERREDSKENGRWAREQSGR